MQFNSIEFIFYFLPAFLAIYYIVPVSWRNAVLTVGSLMFLAFNCSGSYWWLAFLAGMTVVTWAVGKLVCGGRRKWLLVLGLILLGGVLVFFRTSKGSLILPLGLSFYSLQMAAYMIDCYRGKLEQPGDLLQYATQIMMFPKLISGPLMNPSEIRRQVWGRGYLPEHFHRGLQELILGLGLKVLLADRLGGLWSQAAVFGYESISTPFAWMALIAFALQLYYDFWGYSLMAMGLGRMLGFDLPRNFHTPYASKTVSEFYRRWHMSLGGWFKDYVYFPMGGSRCGKWRVILNLAVVWLLTGLWHGFGVNYLLWAGILFFCIANEKLWLGKLMNRSHVVCHVYVIFAILMSWLPFAAGDPAQTAAYLGRLFAFAGETLNPRDYLIWGRRYIWLLLGGLTMATPLPMYLWERIKDKWWVDAVLFAVFWIVIYFVSTSAQDPFVYFQY